MATLHMIMHTPLRSPGKQKFSKYGKNEIIIYLYPHGPVKAVSSMLNFGSPKPPVLTVPDGLESCCTICWAPT